MTMIIATITRNISRRLVQAEWTTLSQKLIRLYGIHERDSRGRPPRTMQALLISGEDHRFFSHYGIDPIAVCRVVWRRCVHWKREGASTIEMQLVRVLTGRYERTVSRKLREAALATLVSVIVPKSELPALYLRVAYYGWHMNGFTEACRRLNLNPSSMSRQDAAGLVARLKYPEPREMPPRRRKQIEMRQQHLLFLSDKHALNNTYRGIMRVPDYETI